MEGDALSQQPRTKYARRDHTFVVGELLILHQDDVRADFVQKGSINAQQYLLQQSRILYSKTTRLLIIL